MNPISTLLLAVLAGIGATLPAHAAGQVEVSYVRPEQFRDAGRGEIDRERTMAALTQYLQRLGKRMPDSQTLRIEVTDIDLAGEIYPGRWINDLRVLRGGADWPRLTLSYTLLDGSRTLKAGVAQLSDPGYMFSQRGRPAADSEMSYEKRMLKQWFDENIVAQR